MNIDYTSIASRDGRLRSASAVRFPTGREVSPLRAWSWLVAGWRAAIEQPVLWLSVVLLCADFITLTSLLPLLKPLAVLLAPLMVAVLMVVQDGAGRDEPVSLRDACVAIGRRSNALCLVGLYAAIIVAVGYFAMLATFDVSMMSSVAANGVHNVSISYGGASGLRGTLEVIFGVSVYVIAVAAACFAPALVMLHEMTPFDAMTASLGGALRNWQVTLGCLILATLAVLFTPVMSFALRAFVLTPALTALPLLMIYGAYRDVFVGKSA